MIDPDKNRWTAYYGVLVAVGGTGVFVGGTGVLVGGTGVFVAVGTVGVAVTTQAVCDGGSGVLVKVDVGVLVTTPTGSTGGLLNGIRGSLSHGPSVFSTDAGIHACLLSSTETNHDLSEIVPTSEIVSPGLSAG